MSTSSPPRLIPWSDAMDNSSRAREALLRLFDVAEGDNASHNVDKMIRVINSRVNAGGEHSPAVATLIQVLYWSLIVIGITINLLIWFIFIRKPKLRTTRNAFIVNLCTSDILLCCITMPFTLKFIIEAKWTFGLYLCKLVPLIQCSNILVATSTVIIIALDRYNTIVKSPCACPKRLPPVVSICCLWLVALALSSPLWLVSETVPVPFPDPKLSGHRPAVFVLYEVCREQWPNDATRLVFTFSVLVIQYLAPICTLAVTHSRIKAFLHQHMANGSIGNRIKAEIQRNRRVTLVLTLIVVVYAVSWLPYHLFTMADELKLFEAPVRAYSLVFAICHLLAMTSAVTNPVLYGLLNTNFQREWRQLVPRGLSTLCRGADTRLEQPSGAPTNTVPMLTVQRHDQLSSTAVSMLPAERASRRRTDTQL